MQTKAIVTGGLGFIGSNLIEKLLNNKKYCSSLLQEISENFRNSNKSLSTSSFKQKKYTIHPELLDKSGNITEEELLTVRFSNDNDSTLEEKGSTTD